MEAARSKLLASAAYLHAEEVRLHLGVLAAAAAAAVAFGALPVKLNPLIQPLMSSIRREGDPLLQRQSAAALAGLIKVCTARVPSPVNKISQNIIVMACADPSETPRAEAAAGGAAATAAAAAAAATVAAAAGDVDELTEHAVARRGAEATMCEMSHAFGEHLFTSVPKLWELMAWPLAPAAAAVGEVGSTSPPAAPQTTSPPAAPQTIIDGLQLLKVLGPVVHSSLRPRVLQLVNPAFAAAVHGGGSAALQGAAAGALASLAAAAPDDILPGLLALVVPALEDAGEADDAAAMRRGGAAVAAALVSKLGTSLAPCCVLLLVPLMGRMSDPVVGPPPDPGPSVCRECIPALLPPPALSLSPLEEMPSQRDGGDAPPTAFECQ